VGLDPDFATLERVVGAVGGRAGSFVLQVRGTYRDGTAHTDYPNVPFTLDYSLE
jgi:hypothetical protein